MSELKRITEMEGLHISDEKKFKKFVSEFFNEVNNDKNIILKGVNIINKRKFEMVFDKDGK